MSKTVVLTGVGRDRVGIVADLAESLFQQGCNLLDSSMTLLRGEFAIILMVRLSQKETLDQLRQRIQSIESKLGMNIHIRELADDELADKTTTDQPHMISVYGADKPGIVAGITRALADLDINITDVETKYTGDDTAKPVFLMVLEVTVPPSYTTDKLRSALKQVSQRLGVDVAVESIEVLEL